MKKVVIAEKPSMARDIARVIGANESHDGYLSGNDYAVTWAFGHLIELFEPESETKKWSEVDLPILHPLEMRPKKDVGKQLKIIDKLFSSADEIICAADAGREGELIFRLIYRYLSCKKPVRRLWISSLTDSAIRSGFENLRQGSDYDNLYFSALARSEADFYVGINATRALTLSQSNGDVFSLGRVQTPSLAIVCRRFLENKNFTPEPYWIIKLSTGKSGIDFILSSPRYTNENDARDTCSSIRNKADFNLQKVTKKEKKEQPPLLYDLTGLQKDASSKYGITPDSTLTIAQSLYEKKHISYPRTGSAYISEDVFDTIPPLIAKCNTLDLSINRSHYSNNPTLSARVVNSSKVTDHHALLPTEVLPKLEDLTKPESTIYCMIVTRMYEAFHEACIKEITQVTASVEATEFTCSGTVIQYAGWREVSKADKQQQEEEDHPDQALPSLVDGDVLPVQSIEVCACKTKPKPILTDSTLLSYMETAGNDIEDLEAREAMKVSGIGTPATRDAIIRNLLDKNYITRESKKLVPTQKGLGTYEIVKTKSIASDELTGFWEKQLNHIAEGKRSYEEFMSSIKDFVKELTAELSQVAAHSIQSSKDERMESMPTCPKCGKRLHPFAKGIGCEKECGFVIWREVAGKKLTDEQMAKLATNKETPVIKGFTSKSGKAFDAKLVLDGDYKTTFEFVNKNVKKK